ncbi:hypothetical protein KDW_35430 [Dictyobacter vulcani]|uniref:Mannose-6-phosphate isomerase n=1 Tax=Dictyobacter vulcani TaxID=2607529 RepID=A0A5J4KSI6_9CHLR|nr:hypothetical protein KDW_35430 [Dictyobacter vulcani]
MSHIYPIRLHASLHETIWGGRRLEQDQWKTLHKTRASLENPGKLKSAPLFKTVPMKVKRWQKW